jgi:hypothetical protein
MKEEGKGESNRGQGGQKKARGQKKDKGEQQEETLFEKRYN